MSTVFAYNEITGVVALVPARFLTHPILGAHLRAVRNGKTRGRLSEIIQTEAPAEVDTEDEEVSLDLDSDIEEEED